MDLSSVLESFATGSYTVTRQSPSSYGADGRLVAATPSYFEIRASVQPVSGRDLQRLPEGLRTSEIIAVFTATELRTQGPSQDPDLIEIDGDTYEVQKVERWATLGAYYRALALKVEPPCTDFPDNSSLPLDLPSP